MKIVFWTLFEVTTYGLHALAWLKFLYSHITRKSYSSSFLTLIYKQGVTILIILRKQRFSMIVIVHFELVT